MRKVKLYIASSLDGKIARPDGAVDWLPEVPGEDFGYQAFYDTIDANIMGFKTYEVCLSFGGEWPYKGKQSYVFSRNPGKTVIPEARLVHEDPAAFVRRLKDEPGKDIWLIGGGEIIALLHDAGLIDEYILTYIPVVLGPGIPLFPESLRRQRNLRLTHHQVFPGGLVMLQLEP